MKYGNFQIKSASYAIRKFLKLGDIKGSYKNNVFKNENKLLPTYEKSIGYKNKTEIT